jgi:hypothetical protein
VCAGPLPASHAPGTPGCPNPWNGTQEQPWRGAAGSLANAIARCSLQGEVTETPDQVLDSASTGEQDWGHAGRFAAASGPVALPNCSGGYDGVGPGHSGVLAWESHPPRLESMERTTEWGHSDRSGWARVIRLGWRTWSTAHFGTASVRAAQDGAAGASGLSRLGPTVG